MLSMMCGGFCDCGAEEDKPDLLLAVYIAAPGTLPDFIGSEDLRHRLDRDGTHRYRCTTGFMALTRLMAASSTPFTSIYDAPTMTSKVHPLSPANRSS